MKSNLLHLHDIIQEKKLAYFLSTNTSQSTSFWISNEKENYDGKKILLIFEDYLLWFIEHSWWPWRSSTGNGKCILRTQDGWIKKSCQEEQAFICEREMNKQSIPLTIRCGNIQTTTIPSTKLTTTTTTTTTTTARTTTQFIPPIANKKLQKPDTIDPSRKIFWSINHYSIISLAILAAVLCGIAIVIFSVNIVICFLCKR